MFPSFHSKSFREYRSSDDQNAIIDSAVDFHPFTHCVEVITNNPNPPEIPAFGKFFHVLLDAKCFKCPEVVDDLFKTTTRFLSLSPISSGNGLFAQNGSITFVLNGPTYQRLGLTGKKIGDDHLIVVTNANRGELHKIRPCEPIEGLLISEHAEIYLPFLKKYSAEEQVVNAWRPASSFHFDVNSLNNEEQLQKDWMKSFMEAVDRSMLEREKIVVSNEFQRMSIEGIFDLRSISRWIKSIANDGWAILLVWDMKDVPGSFLGKKKLLQGHGGGCEIVLFGAALKKAHKIQTIEYVDEE